MTGCHLSRAVQVAVMAVGGILLAAALAANQAWLDQHFLPMFFFSREKRELQESLVRLFAGLLGLGLVLAGPALHRRMQHLPAREIAACAVRIILATGLALGATEFFLARKFLYAAAESTNEEPRRRPDALLGWSFVPGRTGHAIVGGRAIDYVIDAHGYRVRRRDAPVDPDAPAILFTGESIMAGYGLTWEESIPARVGMRLKLESADMAVFGYGTDQSYMRLKNELPRFRHPVALVSIFAPALFLRNLGDDRPWLDASLGWHPAVHRWRLSSLLRFFVPYHSQAQIARGIAATRAVLADTAMLAHKRHAIALVVDPQFGPEQPAERMLRERVLDESGLAYVRVDLDPAWRLKGDLHPSPRAAQAIADAIARRLQSLSVQQRP